MRKVNLEKLERELREKKERMDSGGRKENRGI